jgi:hypothetical protein
LEDIENKGFQNMRLLRGVCPEEFEGLAMTAVFVTLNYATKALE